MEIIVKRSTQNTMKINVINVGTDIYTGPRHKIAVNAIDVEIDKKKYELPKAVPNRAELTYSQTSKIKLDESMFQSVHRISNISQIRQTVERTDITNQYKTLLQRRPNSVGDFYLQYPQNNILKQSDRELIHEIQVNAGAIIISDYELNREQNENIFESDIIQLRKDYPKHLACPTIDIGMQTENLFGKKVDKIIGSGFDRFNVIYRSTQENRANWLDLSIKLLGKNIWCNVVGVTPRWKIKSRLSNLARVFAFGVHTASLGYPWQSSANVPSYNLNGNTLCYELIRTGMTYPESRVASINTHQQQLIIARKHIINRSYFTKYVPTKIELLNHVRSVVA
jgi:hypothetical protein